ncbi:MAG TPA: hypothetical protein VGQ37_14970 [Vicinamibacterales bacterium]|nr:hypothetical protein [Vicinamibacterales bacterium]
MPGSNLSGVSVSLPQEIDLIVAYVDDNGDIVAPPSGVTDVDFSLEKTTRFVGIAMNSGSSTDPDYALQTSTAGFDMDNTARVVLEAQDYGGFTVVRAQQQGGSDTATLAVPADANGNLIADHGWQTAGGLVADNADRSADADASSGSGFTGDGLTVFEEYRGFIVLNQHKRLSPLTKDLFVYSDLTQGQGYAGNLGINVWDIAQSELAVDGDVNFNYANSGYGAITGNYRQKGMRIFAVAGTSSSDFAQTYTYGTPGDPISPVRGPAYVTNQRIYYEKVRLFSPGNNNTTTVDTVDDEMLRQTTAHEIGHGLNLPDVSAGGSCTPGSGPPVPTVMVTNYYPQTTNLSSCPWLNIPHSYTSTELQDIRLR